MSLTTRRDSVSLLLFQIEDSVDRFHRIKTNGTVVSQVVPQQGFVRNMTTFENKNLLSDKHYSSREELEINTSEKLSSIGDLGKCGIVTHELAIRRRPACILVDHERRKSESSDRT
jgi:hypothetical protein